MNIEELYGRKIYREIRFYMLAWTYTLGLFLTIIVRGSDINLAFGIRSLHEFFLREFLILIISILAIVIMWKEIRLSWILFNRNNLTIKTSYCFCCCSFDAITTIECSEVSVEKRLKNTITIKQIAGGNIVICDEFRLSSDKIAEMIYKACVMAGNHPGFISGPPIVRDYGRKIWFYIPLSIIILLCVIISWVWLRE